MQRQAARFVKSDYRRRSSVTTMLDSLNWVSLASRRAEAKLVMLYRITNNLVDVTTSALTAAPTRTRSSTHRYLQPFTRIEAYTHSFFPSTIKSCNKYTQQLVSKQSLNSFRRLLQSMPTYVHIYVLLSPPHPPRNTTHYLRSTKLDNTLATYIHGYYRVLSYNEKKKK